MSSPVPRPLPAELDALLRRMRLPHMRRTAPAVLATARAQRWDPAEVLKLLLNEEVAGRERSALATRRVEAASPTGKTFATWDQGLSSIPTPTQTALRTLEWIGRREKLGVLVRRHRADDSVTKAVRAILRARLIVVDDIGLLPVSPDAAEGFYRLVDAAYEKRSVAVSSNVHPAGFDELMPKTLATATVDRLLHHAHVCLTSGDSVRLAQATSGKGVVPLNTVREAGHAA